jgi:hypothetical protein
MCIRDRQTLGPAAGEFQRASRMAALAVGEQQQKQAADAMVAARAKISEYQASQQFATAMKNSTPEVAQYYRTAYQENQERGRVQAAMRETGMDAVGARSQSAVLAGRDQEGLGADGKPLAERQVGKEIYAAQYNAQIDAAGMGKQLSLLNIEMGKSPDIIEKMRTGLGKILGVGGTLDQAAARFEDQRKEIFDKFRNDAAQVEKKTTEKTVGEVLLSRPITETPRGGSHLDGTKSSFGDWFGKDFGADGMMAKLHGPEAVVPQGKVGEFISDMMSKLPKPGGQQDQGTMPSMPSMPSSASMQGQSMDSKTINDLHKQLVDLNTSIKEVSTKMSNVSDNTAYTAKYTKAATGNRNA